MGFASRMMIESSFEVDFRLDCYQMKSTVVLARSFRNDIRTITRHT
jgi:hypothetical protein